MAAVFLGQKIRAKDWLACGFSYVGVIVIATQGNVLGMQFESPLGVVPIDSIQAPILTLQPHSAYSCLVDASLRF